MSALDDRPARPGPAPTSADGTGDWPVVDRAAATVVAPDPHGWALLGLRVRRWLFPSIWLVFLVDPVTALARQGGVRAWAATALLVAFAALYVAAMPAGWGGRYTLFGWLFAAMLAVTAGVGVLAHDRMFALFTFLAVLLVAGYRRWAPIGVAVLTAASLLLPLLPGWGRLHWDDVVTVPLVALAMWGFFSLVNTNRALARARTEVVRLAAENERTRIARDLHDLLGHSLTTITVKVELARKLAEREGAPAAVAELEEIEAVARRSLQEVRAAVSGYREVGLAGELASARQVLRAASVTATLPGSVDVVDPTRSELFGWVVREGVTNVVRHARARSCAISVGPTWVEVVDDGRGLGNTPPAGNGLTGLHERVAAAGGTLSVGACAAGWRLRADVPA